MTPVHEAAERPHCPFNSITCPGCSDRLPGVTLEYVTLHAHDDDPVSLHQQYVMPNDVSTPFGDALAVNDSLVVNDAVADTDGE